jgi:hypothetical protein
MESAGEISLFEKLAEQYRDPCGEVMAPIPGQSWRCVLPDNHDRIEGHLAEDGTAW